MPTLSRNSLPAPLNPMHPPHTQAMMLDVEADCYWCLSKLLDGIQDHYTDAQPGIQRTVFKVKELVRWGRVGEAGCVQTHMIKAGGGQSS